LKEGASTRASERARERASERASDDDDGERERKES
jgi:hypothetical protein